MISAMRTAPRFESSCAPEFRKHAWEFLNSVGKSTAKIRRRAIHPRNKKKGSGAWQACQRPCHEYANVASCRYLSFQQIALQSSMRPGFCRKCGCCAHTNRSSETCLLPNVQELRQSHEATRRTQVQKRFPGLSALEDMTPSDLQITGC